MNHTQPRLQRIRRHPLVLGLVLLLALLVGLWPQTRPATARPAGQAHCRSKTILFVSGSRPLPLRDEPLRFYLSLLGNLVVVRNASEVQATDAIDKAVVIISESVESVEVNTKLRDIEVPIVTWEGWLQDDLRMVEAVETNYGELLTETQLLIVDPNHPLAAGYKGMVTTVINRENKFHWGKPNDNASVVARTTPNDQQALIYAYEAGAQMAGMVAPARRVFLHNATGPNLTSEGLNLFLAAVDWAAGCLEEPATATPTFTATASPTQPSKETATAAATSTATATATATSTATALPGATATPVPTQTATVTPVPTATTTAPPTQTAQPSATVTLTVLPTASATVTGTPAATVALTLQKRDLLFVDGDENNMVSPGDTLLYLITIRNTGSAVARELVLEDQPAPGTVLVANSIQSTHGTVQTGNQPADNRVVIAVGELAPASTALISLRVQVQSDPPALTLANQAQLRYAGSEPSGQQVLASDDPDTQATQDATLTPLYNGVPDFFTTLHLPLISR